MSLDVELFISEIENRPALYDIQLKEYSDRNLKTKLWPEIFEKYVENWTILVLLRRQRKVSKMKDSIIFYYILFV